MNLFANNKIHSQLKQLCLILELSNIVGQEGCVNQREAEHVRCQHKECTIQFTDAA